MTFSQLLSALLVCTPVNKQNEHTHTIFPSSPRTTGSSLWAQQSTDHIGGAKERVQGGRAEGNGRKMCSQRASPTGRSHTCTPSEDAGSRGDSPEDGRSRCRVCTLGGRLGSVPTQPRPVLTPRSPPGLHQGRQTPKRRQPRSFSCSPAEFQAHPTEGSGVEESGVQESVNF